MTNVVRKDEFERVKGTGICNIERQTIYIFLNLKVSGNFSKNITQNAIFFFKNLLYLQPLEEVQCRRVRFQVTGEMPPSFTFPDGTGL